MMGRRVVIYNSRIFNLEVFGGEKICFPVVNYLTFKKKIWSKLGKEFDPGNRHPQFSP